MEEELLNLFKSFETDDRLVEDYIEYPLREDNRRIGKTKSFHYFQERYYDIFNKNTKESIFPDGWCYIFRHNKKNGAKFLLQVETSSNEYRQDGKRIKRYDFSDKWDIIYHIIYKTPKIYDTKDFKDVIYHRHRGYISYNIYLFSQISKYKDGNNFDYFEYPKIYITEIKILKLNK
jgi:hypothetical protein